jgi:zinc transporter
MTAQDKSGILHAFMVDSDRCWHPVGNDRISEEIKNEGLAWVHLDARSKKARKWLEKEVSYLDQIVLDALHAEETRPRILEVGKGAMMILRGMNLNENAEPEDMISLRLWVDDMRIISLQHHDSKAVEELVEKLKSGNGPKNAGDFVVMLTSLLFERMEPVLSSLEERLGIAEEKVMENPDVEQRHEVIDIRRQAITFRRYIAPQRDVLAYLRVSDLPLLSDNNKRRIQETLDRVTRYVEDLDLARERAQIVKDELSNALSDRLNRNLFILSVVAAIFLPLSFLTGLLGINVAGIPGAGHPQAFFVVISILALVLVGQISVFKLLKWF